MPIKGLSDRGLAFPEIGQIRKGAKKGENRPGADLTYFRVEFDETESKTKSVFESCEFYAKQIAKLGGPQVIHVIFPFNEIERQWDPWYEAYTAGRMIARSDGEFVQYLLDDKNELVVRNGFTSTGERIPHPADGIAGRDYQGKPVKYKASGRLKVIIPELARAAYLTLMTTSVHDIVNISDQLRGFKELNGGQLAGIPFSLRRRSRLISTPSENGQRVRRKKFLVSIEADPDWVAKKLTHLNSLALPGGGQSLLPAPEEFDADADVEFDDDDFSDEGLPEGGGEVPTLAMFSPAKDRQMIEQAMKAWNVSEKDAKAELAKLSPMTREEFTAWLADKS